MASLRMRASAAWIATCRDLLRFSPKNVHLPTDFWKLPGSDTTSSSSPRLHLRALGFCGIDDSINLEDLADISLDYPFVEWGVLFRSDKTGTPRYASNSMLESIRKFQRPLRLAGHLCGDRVVQVLNGDATFARHLYTCGFRRIQVNATSANGVDTSRLAEQVETLRKVIMETSGIEWIIQKNIETEPLWSGLSKVNPPPNMSVLNDASMGLGIAITKFEPPPSVHVAPKGCGYAGGIGPSNVTMILKAVSEAALERPVWIDMESSLRTKNKKEGDDDEESDIFDLDKCKECAAAAFLLMQGL